MFYLDDKNKIALLRLLQIHFPLAPLFYICAETRTHIDGNP